jgi:5-methyltetrahydrofolate--homocysteine methyltransferase
VSTVSSLLSAARGQYLEEIHSEYDTVRERFESRGRDTKFLTLESARSNALRIDWNACEIVAPAELGVHVVDRVAVGDLRPYIDWTPFFQTWELRGKYPSILEDPQLGSQARTLLVDANHMLDRFVRDGALRPRGVYGLFPSASDGDDIILFEDDNRKNTIGTLRTLRQQSRKTRGKPNRALSDFVAPLESGVRDYVGMFAVTSGHGLEQTVAEFERAHDDYSAIMARALADRLAEAFAEWLHECVRRQIWGYSPEEDLTNEDLILERFRGIRPAPGYPAQPDHTEKEVLWNLLEVEKLADIHLTESLAMHPASSVCGLYIAHPEADYFNVGKLQRDQVVDYATRKGRSLEEMERWLAPHLAYDPAAVSASSPD